MQADDEYCANAVKDLIQSKAVRRNLSLKIFDWGKLEPAGGGTVRQHIGLKRGLTSDQAKEASKIARDRFEKVKPAIQGDAVRVSGKSRDEAQAVIGHLRGLDYGGAPVRELPMTGGPSEEQLSGRGHALGVALREAGWRVAVAESSTGEPDRALDHHGPSRLVRLLSRAG